VAWNLIIVLLQRDQMPAIDPRPPTWLVLAHDDPQPEVPVAEFPDSPWWAGSSYERSKGKNHCVMRKTVAPS
jgi:hypothetical protein